MVTRTRINEDRYKEIPIKDFTVNSFLTNPTGDKGTIAMARKAALESYHNLYYTLVKDKDIRFKFYLVDNSLYFIFRTPSEKFDKLSYDVVIEFLNYTQGEQNLSDKTIRFFSNSPSFAFAYAHAFDAYGAFSTILKDKYPREIFQKIPHIRNPSYQTFYEKSTIMALLYLVNNSLLNDKFVKYVHKVPLAKLKYEVAPLASILQAYNALKKEAKKKKETPVSSKHGNVIVDVKGDDSFRVITRRVNKQISTKNRRVIDLDTRKRIRKLNTKVNFKVDNKVDNKVR